MVEIIVITKRIRVIVIIIREDKYNSLFDKDKRKKMILKKEKRHVLTKRKKMILKKEKERGSPPSA